MAVQKLSDIVGELKRLDKKSENMELFLEKAAPVVEAYLDGQADRHSAYRNIINCLSKEERLPQKLAYLVDLMD